MESVEGTNRLFGTSVSMWTLPYHSLAESRRKRPRSLTLHLTNAILVFGSMEYRTIPHPCTRLQCCFRWVSSATSCVWEGNRMFEIVLTVRYIYFSGI